MKTVDRCAPKQTTAFGVLIFNNLIINEQFSLRNHLSKNLSKSDQKNVQNRGKISCISVSKVKLSLHRLLQISQVPSSIKQRIPIQTFTQISRTWPV
jgi:hypothetical protein